MNLNIYNSNSFQNEGNYFEPTEKSISLKGITQESKLSDALKKKKATIKGLIKNISKCESRKHRHLKAKLYEELNETLIELTNLLNNQFFSKLSKNVQIKSKKIQEKAKNCLEKKKNIEHTSLSLPNWLNKDLKFSPKSAVLIAGDSFAKSADFEGGTKEELEELLTLAEICLTASQDILNSSVTQELIEQFENLKKIKSILNKIETLNNEEKLTNEF